MKIITSAFMVNGKAVVTGYVPPLFPAIKGRFATRNERMVRISK